MNSDWPDETDADLFLEAQDSVWQSVVAELKAGRKTGYWIWFVFPQLAELGRSDMSQLYGIHDLAEARAYLAHSDLRARLVHVSTLMLTHQGTAVDVILGTLDAQKLQSSMTLFAAVPDAPPEFEQVLDAFFDGRRCQTTLRAIS
ncbi:DUF1810 domain-containing protein [Sedimentitalea nanhaiensis]|uniref:Uncharacterized protein, DUF1810 family n=1 Tax=Sedimentitalea nanhaiensis TaxID=999627 RepID=A0A1I7DQJ6_9RHOB|nr:DUF1810 domain-containing protein [Sedimentitalea nanhaiensis]SFU13894.1 Uncharacterized protein, DUF1810 family [Sedimentitalea nanhaiensis]